jgi:hypothetical protein
MGNNGNNSNGIGGWLQSWLNNGQGQSNGAPQGGGGSQWDSFYGGSGGTPGVSGAGTNGIAGPGNAGNTPTFLQSLLGFTDNQGNQNQGFGGLALGAAQGAASTYLGMKQYGLAKDSFKQNKREFNLNYDAQRQNTNTRLEDRQRARVSSQAGSPTSSYESVSSYMDKNAVKPRG